MPGWKMSAVAIASAISVGVVAVGPADAARMISGTQIRNSSVTGADIKNKSLTASDFNGSLVGRQGAPGTPGAAGTPGPAGTIAGTIEAIGPVVPTGATGTGANVQSSKAECPPGTVVTGGGYHGGVRTFIADATMSGNGYFVIAVNNGPLNESIQATAVCGIGAAATLTRMAINQRDVQAAEQKRLAGVRAQL